MLRERMAMLSEVAAANTARMSEIQNRITRKQHFRDRIGRTGALIRHSTPSMELTGAAVVRDNLHRPRQTIRPMRNQGSRRTLAVRRKSDNRTSERQKMLEFFDFWRPGCEEFPGCRELGRVPLRKAEVLLWELRETTKQGPSMAYRRALRFDGL